MTVQDSRPIANAEETLRRVLSEHLAPWGQEEAVAALDEIMAERESTRVTLALIASHAQAGLTEIADGVPNATTYWLEAIGGRARRAWNQMGGGAA